MRDEPARLLGGAALCSFCRTYGLLWKYTHFNTHDHLSPVENDENDIPQTAKNSATHIGSATLWPRGLMCVATHTLLTTLSLSLHCSQAHRLTCTTWTSSATAGVQVQSSSCEAYFFLYLTVLQRNCIRRTQLLDFQTLTDSPPYTHL